MSTGAPQSTASELRILLVEHQTCFREAITQALSAEPDFAEVAHCGTLEEALEIIGRSAIDVLLLVHELGFERGSRFISAVRKSGYSGRILVMTAWVSDSEARSLIKAGAAGIFLTEQRLAVLTEAVRAVARRGAWFEPRYLGVITGVKSQVDEQPVAPIHSERERKVVDYLLEGLSNKEIGLRLQISETSVKRLLQGLFHKTGVRTRGQLVKAALERYHDLM